MKILPGYIIHQTVALPRGLDLCEGYATFMEDMIHRALHGTATYRADNRKVWNIISSITREEECWS